MSIKPIPDGYHSITPYLVIKGAAQALEFYKKAFGATEIMRFDGPGGTVAHAEIKIGDSVVMVSDEWPDMGYKSPLTYGGSGSGLCIYVPNVDEVYNQAVAAGAKIDRAVQDQFYGDRSGCLTDPFGHRWTVATHIEDVSPEECKRRMDAMMAQPSAV